MADAASFCAAVADVLEVDSIGLGDDFRAVPDWCSLKAFGLLVTLENDWATPLDVARFQKLKTVGDLWQSVGGDLRAPRRGDDGPPGGRSLPCSI